MQVPAKIRNGNKNTSHTECFLSNFICREITSVFYPLPSVHPSVQQVCCTSVCSEQESCFYWAEEAERRVLFITRTLSDVWIQMSTGWTNRLRPCRFQLCVKQHVECLSGHETAWLCELLTRLPILYLPDLILATECISYTEAEVADSFSLELSHRKKPYLCQNDWKTRS